MTLPSPRIYTYKITFEEVPYYYYGVHKEKKYNEYYMGSPVTNKWCWELYAPKKQILELFDFTDEGWLEAQEVEKRLIRPVFNTDKWCLNESCGAKISLEVRRKTGQRTYELGIGVHSQTPEQRKELGKKCGKRNYELRIGVHGRSNEQIINDSKKGGYRTYELGVGCHALSKEELSRNSKKIIEMCKENETGLFSFTEEEKYEICKRGGETGGKVVSSQKWLCLETGHISTPGGLSRYQIKRGIGTHKRKRVM